MAKKNNTPKKDSKKSAPKEKPAKTTEAPKPTPRPAQKPISVEHPAPSKASLDAVTYTLVQVIPQGNQKKVIFIDKTGAMCIIHIGIHDDHDAEIRKRMV